MANTRLFFFLALCIPAALCAQPGVRLSGRVTEARSGEGVPFATVKKPGTLEGTVADLDGFFSFTLQPGDSSILQLEASQYGYDRRTVSLRNLADSVFIRLSSNERSIDEVVVRPRYDKIRRIINQASRARSDHNPDRYPFYRANVYYKMIADADFSVLATDSAQAREARAFANGQHLIVSETYSRRIGRSPGQVQEDVLATRFSGLPNTALASFVTNVLPFHAASDFLVLNGRDYHSPLAGGWEGRYLVNLSEELQEGSDTIWVMSFRPRRDPAGLRGRISIHSDGFAVSRLLAEARDTTLGHVLRIEQQYEQVEGRWFPKALNYVLDWRQKTSGITTPIYMRGTSRIDSVSFLDDRSLKIDKAHTVRVMPGAERTPEQTWARYRLETLGTKEARTYVFNDSLVEEMGLAKFIPYLDEITEGFFPIGPFDLDLKRLYAVNPYEKNRVGLGWQTNERISRSFTLGAWFGYGTQDKDWKYGAYGEVYAGKYQETVFRLQYDRDLRDPGRVNLHRDFDKNYLRQFLLQRVDMVEAVQLSARAKMGYLQAEVAGRMETIQPMYDYTFLGEKGSANSFEAREGILNLRYAFGEKSAPAFGKYYASGTKYPVLYGRLTTGQLTAAGDEVGYTQALAAVSWTGAINRIGRERVLLLAGQSWSDAPLPLSKLFAGRGFRGDRTFFYVFGGLLTMRPYEYYSDRFASLHLRHDFLWKLYHHPHSTPSISLGYNGLIGTMENRSRHIGPAFSVPDNAYHEAGLLLNDIIRVKYFSVAYFSLNGGYFYHITPGRFSHKDNGAFVVGLGFTI